jgi:methylated-DNA-[protein]-cysteine S-methyltransferase
MKKACIWKTERGWMGALVGDDDRLRRLLLPRPGRREVLEALESRGRAELGPCPELEDCFRRYFEDGLLELPLEPDISQGTAFQRRVWEEAGKIPRGEVRSYGWLAKRIGIPGGARAVGQAMGSNPLPIVVPCHRVVAADGGLGGFSSGLENKRFLLSLEGVRL